MANRPVRSLVHWVAFGLSLVVLSSVPQAVLQAQTCSGVTLTVSDAPDPINPGGVVTHTITLNRSTALLNATLTDVLPASLRFLTLTSPMPCTVPAILTSGTITCTFNYDPERLYAVDTSNQLFTFALHAPGTALSGPVPITGLQAAESILAIDVRPATQQLYGLGSTSRLYVINPATGAATQVGAGAFTPALNGAAFGMDFQPVVDRIRVISDTEQNIRLNPNNGTVAGVDTALSPVGTHVGLAYTNNVSPAPLTTTAYVIDFTTDSLKLLGGINGTPSANTGIITHVGSLGVVTSNTNIGFDVSPTGTAYALLPVGGISRLYTINLGTGAATLIGAFPANNFRDIAVAPSVSLTHTFTLGTNVAAATASGSQITNTVSVSSSSESCTSTGSATTSVLTPSLTLTPGTVNFGASVSAGAISAVTPPQTLTLLKSGPGTVTWTAAANVPWLTVSPASGSGSASLIASLTTNGALLPPNGPAAATITVTGVGSSNSPTASVNLTVLAPPQEQAPFGSFDTPADGQGNVTGAIPVTGWALDDIGVSRVRIFRNPIAGESPGQLVFIGDAVFVNGARPDVAATYPTTPLKDQAGWGYMLLTNFLPNQGNGTFTLVAQATDVEGHTTTLGSRTITCTNATATAPFGTIDTPSQGGIASGTAYVNFGWALTPQPKTIPINGSTIQVFIDSAPVSGLDAYNLPRPDIQALFPGYNNTDGAVGHRTLDTTALANGVHTIAWGLTDDQGAAAGIGSRYFTVVNGSGPLTEAPASTAGLVIAGNALADTPPALTAVDPETVRRYRIAQLERLVVDLGDGARSGVVYRGYEIVDDRLVALPVGSHLDARTGEFAWAPGLAFGGTHRLVFVRREDSDERQIRIDVTIDAERADAGRQARVTIDTPPAGAEVGQPFTVAGWAIDPAGPRTGTGIDVLHVWAHPVDGGAPRFLGVAAYGGKRPDVAAAFGARFLESGFGVNVADLPAGTYDVVVYGFSKATGGFSVTGSVRVTVR